MPTVENRVDRLELALENFTRNVGIEFNKLYNSQMRTEAELREFKDEMREFKNEMKEFKDETKEESKKRNREWSNLARKMGTIVEDLIAPALRPVLGKYFECEVNMEGQRMFRRKEGKDYEIDAIAMSDDKVFMVEVRATPRVDDVNYILDKKENFSIFSLNTVVEN